MAWLPVDQSLGHHRKTRQLARALGVERPTAVGYLVFLWSWALDNAPDGVLTGIPAEDLCDAACRNCQKGEEKCSGANFIKALVKTGFLDRKGQGGRGLYIHDWEQYGGKLCEARAKHRDRMRQSRELIRVEESRVEESRVEESREEKSRSESSPPTPPPAAFNPETDSFLEPTPEELAAIAAGVKERFPGKWKVKNPKEAP